MQLAEPWLADGEHVQIILTLGQLLPQRNAAALDGEAVAQMTAQVHNPALHMVKVAHSGRSVECLETVQIEVGTYLQPQRIDMDSLVFQVLLISADLHLLQV